MVMWGRTNKCGVVLEGEWEVHLLFVNMGKNGLQITTFSTY